MKLGGKKEGKRKKSLRGIGRKDKYFWLIFAGILLLWFGAELRGSSFAHSHTLCSPEQIIQQRAGTANAGGVGGAALCRGGRGWLSSGRSSSLCLHTGKDYPRDQQ